MINTIHNNQQVLQQIEWDTIKSKVLAYVHFELNEKNLLTYLNDNNFIKTKLDNTQAFQEHMYSFDFTQFLSRLAGIDPEIDFPKYLAKIEKSHALSLYELNQLAITLEIFQEYKKLFKNKLQFELENEDRFSHKITKDFIKPLRVFTMPDGTVELHKHPKLRNLYEKQIELETQIRQKLDHLLKNGEFAKRLQFDSYDIIHDRYVLPLRSDSFNRSIGQIISRSDSGNTLFVEPSQISNLNYQRLDIIVEIQSIVAKIESEFTEKLVEYTHEISQLAEFYFHCDEYNSRAKFANQFNLTRPFINSQKKVELKKFFHPLIPNPVTNDLEITQDQHGLIISGPNTGGKTATLKSMALVQLFLRYGFFIPATHGDVYLYDRIFYFGNDQQNLNEGLSSFSAEVENYMKLIESLGESNLILIDEIFNSTSSEEASALALAFFKKLNQLSNIHLIVSSHHQTLKTMLHQNNDYISAHVGFDLDTNSPTYKLHYGAPGNSHALKVFRNISGLNDVFDNALHYLDNTVIHYEKLLESLAKKENELTKLLTENKEINQHLKNQKKSIDGISRLKIEEEVQRVKHKLDKVLSEAQTLVKQVKRGQFVSARQVDKTAAKINSAFKEHLPKEEKPQKSYDNLSIPKKFNLNQKYFCLSLEKTVILTKIERNNKYGMISHGNINMKVKLSTLREANKPKEYDDTPSHFLEKSRTAKIEYDCRGMRLEEFQSLIEDAISDLLLGELPYLNIIHGHGTGVLKGWLRKYAKNHKDLAIVPTETGNDGETKIALKN